MASEYAQYDWEVADYDVYILDPEVIDPETDEPLQLRGPRPRTVEGRPYFVCVGAAQTFGRFCVQPFPQLLAERLGIPALNVSRGGAGPSFFLKSDKLLNYINGSSFAIVQVLAGRSESNSLFESKGIGYYRRRSDGSGIGCDDAFGELLAACDELAVAKIIEETRNNWVNNYLLLLRKIKVPTILLWFSSRSPEYIEKYDTITALFGDFPQLVNQEMVNYIKNYANAYVECVSSSGLPQKLFSRFTGEPTTIKDPWGPRWVSNWYYPSPAMHLEAGDALEKTCRALWTANEVKLRG